MWRAVRMALVVCTGAPVRDGTTRTRRLAGRASGDRAHAPTISGTTNGIKYLLCWLSELIPAERVNCTYSRRDDRTMTPTGSEDGTRGRSPPRGRRPPPRRRPDARPRPHRLAGRSRRTRPPADGPPRGTRLALGRRGHRLRSASIAGRRGRRPPELVAGRTPSSGDAAASPSTLRRRRRLRS